MEKITWVDITLTQNSDWEVSEWVNLITEEFLNELKKILSSWTELFVENWVLFDKQWSEKRKQNLLREIGKMVRS